MNKVPFKQRVRVNEELAAFFALTLRGPMSSGCQCWLGGLILHDRGVILHFSIESRGYVHPLTIERNSEEFADLLPALMDAAIEQGSGRYD